jgi:anti-sigma B factor antagonist
VTEGNSRLSPARPDTASLSPAVRGGPWPAADEGPAVWVRHEPGYVLVSVAGEVDYAAVAGLREPLFALAGTGRPLVADLDRVSFIDAAGVGVLAGAARRAAAHGGSLQVVCTSGQTRRPFRLTGLDQVVPLAGSLAEALAALAALEAVQALAAGANADAV